MFIFTQLYMISHVKRDSHHVQFYIFEKLRISLFLLPTSLFIGQFGFCLHLKIQICLFIMIVKYCFVINLHIYNINFGLNIIYINNAYGSMKKYFPNFVVGTNPFIETDVLNKEQKKILFRQIAQKRN